MKCPHCLAANRFVRVTGLIPGFLFPLHLFVGYVKCDSCLRFFCHVRGLGWLIPVAAPVAEEIE